MSNWRGQIIKDSRHIAGIVSSPRILCVNVRKHIPFNHYA